MLSKKLLSTCQTAGDSLLFSVDGTSTADPAPTSVLMAFRNASFGSVSVETRDRDDPPAVTTSSGDAVVIAHHVQDDNFRTTPGDSDLPTAAGNAFRYFSSETSSATLTWYNLSPPSSYNVGDITVNAPVGDMGASTVVLNQSGSNSIQFIGVDNGNESSTVGTSSPLVTIASDAISGLQSGDLLLVYISDDFQQTFNSVSEGWNTGYAITNPSGFSAIALFYKTIP